MSNHSELRDLRSEGMYFKNKYEFMILKITLIPHIKEAFVSSNVNTKSTLQYGGTRLRSCLRHCAASLKVAGSIHDGVSGIFH